MGGGEDKGRLGDWVVSRFVDKSMGQAIGWLVDSSISQWVNSERQRGETDGIGRFESGRLRDRAAFQTATVPSSVSWQLDPLCGMSGACCSSRAHKLYGVSCAREEWLARPCGHLGIKGPWEDGR